MAVLGVGNRTIPQSRAFTAVILGLDPRIFLSINRPGFAGKQDPRVKPEDDAVGGAGVGEHASSPHPPRRRGSSGALCGGSFLKTTGSRPSPGTRTTSCPLPERAPHPLRLACFARDPPPPVLRTGGGPAPVVCLPMRSRGRWIARGACETEGDGVGVACGGGCERVDNRWADVGRGGVRAITWNTLSSFSFNGA